MIVASPPHLELDVSLLSGEWVTFQTTVLEKARVSKSLTNRMPKSGITLNP